MGRYRILEKNKKVIDIPTGAVKVSGRNVVLSALAIGSCVAVAAYDPVQKAGGIAHIMLPGLPERKAVSRGNRYASVAIKALIGRLKRLGTKIKDLEICLIGGANVLRKGDDTICQNNIDSVTGIFREKNIRIRTKELGGTRRRSMDLDIAKGIVFYSVEGEKRKVLWQKR